MDLYGEVLRGVLGESFCRNDVDALCCRFCLESLVDTVGIYVRGVVNNAYLRIREVFRKIVRRADTLVRVGEAYSERVVTLDGFHCGTGRGKLEHVVLRGQRYNRGTRRGSNGTH